jgi:glycosyltransferase involved in cell wall biosynthesis
VISLPVQPDEPNYSDVIHLEEILKLRDKYTIGSFGRMASGKNYELLINSFSNLKIENAHLLMIGSPSTKEDIIYYDSLKRLVTSLGLDAKVTFIKHQTNIIPYYKLLKIYIHPGVVSEGFGLTVAEAMYLGVPVVSSNYGAMEDFVLPNETGLVIKTRSEGAQEALTNSIIHAYTNELEMKKYSTVAQGNIKTRFSSSSFNVAITDVYQFLNSID